MEIDSWSSKAWSGLFRLYWSLWLACCRRFLSRSWCNCSCRGATELAQLGYNVPKVLHLVVKQITVDLSVRFLEDPVYLVFAFLNVLFVLSYIRFTISKESALCLKLLLNGVESIADIFELRLRNHYFE